MSAPLARRALELRKSLTPGRIDGASPLSDQRPHDAPAFRRLLCCIGCGEVITDDGARIEMAGRHEHTCVNPAGITYRIGCFRSAPGCLGVGAWSSFFSWFPGWLWQIACCHRCSMHLGWAFEPERGATAAHRFHGLIRNRLREQTEQAADP